MHEATQERGNVWMDSVTYIPQIPQFLLRYGGVKIPARTLYFCYYSNTMTLQIILNIKSYSSR